MLNKSNLLLGCALLSKNQGKKLLRERQGHDEALPPEEQVSPNILKNPIVPAVTSCRWTGFVTSAELVAEPGPSLERLTSDRKKKGDHGQNAKMPQCLLMKWR